MGRFLPCKQIREEVGSYLYKLELIVEDMTALQTFVAQIGQYNRDMLTEITIKGWGTGRGVHKVCPILIASKDSCGFVLTLCVALTSTPCRLFHRQCGLHLEESHV